MIVFLKDSLAPLRKKGEKNWKKDKKNQALLLQTLTFTNIIAPSITSARGHAWMNSTPGINPKVAGRATSPRATSRTPGRWACLSWQSLPQTHELLVFFFACFLLGDISDSPGY
jgi:hypothetical protein